MNNIVKSKINSHINFLMSEMVSLRQDIIYLKSKLNEKEERHNSREEELKIFKDFMKSNEEKQ